MSVAELVPIDLRWPGAWEQIEHWFDDALVRSGAIVNWSVEDLRQMGLTRQLTFWGVVLEGKLIGAAAFQEVIFPQRRVLEIPFLGMNANTEDYWIPIFETIKSNAKQAGFDAVVGGGRPGWARKLGGKVVYRCEFNLEGE